MHYMLVAPLGWLHGVVPELVVLWEGSQLRSLLAWPLGNLFGALGGLGRTFFASTGLRSQT